MVSCKLVLFTSLVHLKYNSQNVLCLITALSCYYVLVIIPIFIIATLFGVKSSRIPTFISRHFIRLQSSSPAVTRRGAQKAKIQTRGMHKEEQQKQQQNRPAVRQPNAALAEAKRKARENLSRNSSGNNSDAIILCKDIYQSAMDAAKMVRGQTGLVYDNRMAEHLCLWDSKYPECPERFTRVMER